MPYNEIVPGSAAAAPAGISFGEPATGDAKKRTLLQMRTRLIEECGNLSNRAQSFWDDKINEAYHDLATSKDARFDELRESYSFTTVADQPLYTLPPGVYTISRVAIAEDSDAEDGQPLRKMGMDSYSGLQVSDGRPTDVGREQGVLVLWPTPDGAYDVTVDIRVEPQPLTADNHQIILDSEWNPIIYYMAKSIAMEALQNYTEALIATNRANQMAARKLGKGLDEVGVVGGIRPVRNRSDLQRTRRHRLEGY